MLSLILILLAFVITAFLAFFVGAVCNEYHQNDITDGKVSTRRLSEAALTLLLTKAWSDKFVKVPDLRYSEYDGSKLPGPSGYSLANACLTYVSHGGAKSRAIERFLDKHLRTYDQVEQFLKQCSEGYRPI